MRALMTLALVGVMLAGCSKDAPTPLDVEATHSTGVIRGIILDTTLTPVANVNVTIEGFETLALSNADGAFGFDGLTEGRYVLNAQRGGYHAASAAVDVVAGVGEPEFVKLRMQPKVTSEPFVQPHQWDGFLQCSYRAVQVADNCPEGETEVTHGVPQVPDWAQSELAWESTQVLGDALSFQYSIPNTRVDYIEAEGPSPLNLFATPEVIDKEGLGDGLDIYLRVFTADLEQSRPPTGHWGVGVQVDQQFTVYTHVFYDFAPPTGWTFLADGPIAP